LEKSPRQQTKHQQRAEQRLHRCVGKTQRTGPLTIDHHRFVELTKHVFAHRAIVAEGLDVQQTPIGLKAAARNAGRLCSRLPMPKSRVS